MNECNPPGIVTLFNQASTVSIDPSGGAIAAFKLAGSGINPLSFAFTQNQMPGNNKGGATYKGHFACIGRWGEATSGEKNRGVPNHGEAANSLWTIDQQDDTFLLMQTMGIKEGLLVERKMFLDEQQPLLLVKETVANTQPLGKMFNMVQHPTLAAPFLNSETRVDSNATTGFDQLHYKEVTNNLLRWPSAKTPAGLSMDICTPLIPYNSVFSFVVDETSQHGWITAYSPASDLLIGYVWKRSDYPWIHCWQHFQDDQLQYRGIEFGTAGIHQTFPEILQTATHLLGERTVTFLDAGESVSKSYYVFLQAGKAFKTGISNIELLADHILITPRQGTPVQLSFKNKHNGL